MAKATERNPPTASTPTPRQTLPVDRGKTEDAKERPKPHVKEAGMSICQPGSWQEERLDIRELRGTGGIRSDYDHKALRAESA